jgi:hypothetical protein
MTAIRETTMDGMTVICQILTKAVAIGSSARHRSPRRRPKRTPAMKPARIWAFRLQRSEILSTTALFHLAFFHRHLQVYPQSCSL